jgi:hypothetical protein
MQPIPVPQVGFRRSGESEFTWICEADLTSESVANYRGPGVETRIVARRDEDLSRLVNRLAVLGVSFEQRGTFHEPVTDAENKVWVETAFAVDPNRVSSCRKNRV